MFLRIATEFYDEIHVNLSGVVFFVILGLGIFHPAWQAQCAQLTAVAGTYLFGAAKNK